MRSLRTADAMQHLPDPPRALGRGRPIPDFRLAPRRRAGAFALLPFMQRAAFPSGQRLGRGTKGSFAADRLKVFFHPKMVVRFTGGPDLRCKVLPTAISRAPKVCLNKRQAGPVRGRERRADAVTPHLPSAY